MSAVRYSLKKWEWKWGLFFISPWILGFLVFYLAPMIASLGFTFMDYNLIHPDEQRFVGLSNWGRAFGGDQQVFASVGRTLLFAAIALPISFGVSLVLALLLNSRLLLGTKLFRALFYLPTMIPLVATVLIWNGVLNEQTGWINILLEKVTGIQATGVSGIRWLANPNLIYFAYAFIGLWGIGNSMLIFLAGLQSVPTELYEAAEVDGASWWTRLTRITLPMITPVLFYNLIIGVIGLMQYFLVPYVINRGDGYPQGTTNFIMVYFYRQSFTYFNMGYGAVIAWVIFVIALIMTVLLFSTSKRWVYYAGEKN